MLQNIQSLFFGLPVVMYHSISTEKNALSIHPKLFEQHCWAMQKKGWQSISLAEAQAYFLAGEPLPKKAVWLTFDDAYLDNFIYAYPILAKYGFKGTIFAVLDMIESGQIIRPTIEDVQRGNLSEAELPPVNQPFVQNSLGFKERKTLFLNWAEIRFLAQSGVFDFSPHSLRHDRVFINGEYNGFFRPGERNRTFDRVQGDIPWGLPLFKNAAALGNRAYLPSAELVAGVKAMVPQSKEGAHQFFKNPEKIAELQQWVASFGPEQPKPLGRLESDEEMQTRFEQEMQTCQIIMQKELGTPSRTFSWPWGAYNAASRAAGQKFGFDLFVTTASGANWPAQLRKTAKPYAQACRFNIKQRSAKQLLARLRILSVNLIAVFYRLVRFRGKF